MFESKLINSTHEEVDSLPILQIQNKARVKSAIKMGFESDTVVVGIRDDYETGLTNIVLESNSPAAFAMKRNSLMF